MLTMVTKNSATVETEMLRIELSSDISMSPHLARLRMGLFADAGKGTGVNGA